MTVGVVGASTELCLTDRGALPQMSYQLTNPAHELACLCSLSSLEEADLCLDNHAMPDLRQWVPPQPGLSSLRRLRLNG